MREQEPREPVTSAQITEASNQIRELLATNPALIQTVLIWQFGGTVAMLGRAADRTTLGAVAALTRANLPGGSVRSGLMAAARSAGRAFRHPIATASAIASAARQAANNPQEAAAALLKRLPIMEPLLVIQRALQQKSLLLANKAFQELITNPKIIAAIDKPTQEAICEILLADRLAYVGIEGAEESLSALVAAVVRLAETPELASAVKNIMSNQAVLLDPDATPEAKSAAMRRLAGTAGSFLHLGQGSILSLSQTILKNSAFVESVFEPMVKKYIAPAALIALITSPYVRVELASGLEAFSVGGVPALLADNPTQSLMTSDIVLTVLATPPAPRTIAVALLGPGGPLEYAAATYDDMKVDWSADGLPSAEEAYKSTSKALEDIIKATAECARSPEVVTSVRSIMTQQAVLLDPNADSKAKNAATLSYVEELTRLLGSQHAVDLSEAIQAHQEFVVAVLDPIVGRYVSPKAVVKLAGEPGVCADLSEALSLLSRRGARALLGSQTAQRLLRSSAILEVLSTEPAPSVIASTMFAETPGAKAALSALIPELCKGLQDKKAAPHIVLLMSNLAIFFDTQQSTEKRSEGIINVGIGLLKLLAEKPDSLDRSIEKHSQFIAEVLDPYIGRYVKPERVVNLLTNRDACNGLAKILELYQNNHEVKAIATLCVKAITNRELRKVVCSAIANAIASILNPNKKYVEPKATDMLKQPPRTLVSGRRKIPGTGTAAAGA